MVMLSVNEEAQILNIRVFKWNEELHNVESSRGLFLFCIIDNVLRNLEFHQRTLKRPELLSVLRIKNKLSVFELVNLSNRDSIKKSVSRAIESRKEDYSDDTTTKLREAVSEYLLGCFKFDIFQPLPSLENPIIIIVVDVAVSKKTNGTRKRHLPSGFSSERQETKDSRDDASTKDSCDDASTRLESVKKRKVGDAISSCSQFIFYHFYNPDSRARSSPDFEREFSELTLQNAAVWFT